ncbi:MAG: amidohydrolase family protein [Myxococcota bacterium]
MIDCIVRGGRVVDGTGRPGVTADVAIEAGRVVAVGRVAESARTEVDADGLVVCPGFVDPHTHYDAQLFWDPYANPSSLHGITSVVAGNCSFALAPLHAEDADYTRRMMARVEGMPLVALEQGVPWGWESFAEYLAALEGRIAVNAGFIAGHSALRRYVLGPDANRRAATPAELERLGRELETAIAAGALGFSTDISESHMDGDGAPIPAKGATPEERLALCAVVGRHEGTTLSGIFEGGSNGWSDFELDHLTRMSATANRVLNWNLMVVDASVPERARQQLGLSHHARAHGGRIVALLMPVIVPMNMSFSNYCALFLIPGWRETMALPPAERMAALRKPETRRHLQATATSPKAGMFRRLSDFAGYVIGDTFSPANAGLSGRVVRDIAAERGVEPFDALIDLVLADELKTVLWPSAPDDDEAHWALRASLWDDPDILLAGSDAGAHLDRMCGGSYPTQFLADCLRGRRMMSVERAVHELSAKPAALFGLRDRGIVRPGAHADLVVFDPTSVGAAPARLVNDLPGGCARVTADPIGMRHVFVNGVETIRDGKVVGPTPGRVLRSGRDTLTVTAR